MSSTLSNKEQTRLYVVKRLLAREITNDLAAKTLDISSRQVKRLKKRVRSEGEQAVIHGLKEKPGNHRISDSVKQKALSVIRQNYSDFKPTFATEKLEENYSISVSPETTRLWMAKEGLWKVRRQKQTTYRSWRPRKDYYGELVQFDGSYHHWFEDRYRDENGNGEVCMLAAIDDATGQITKATFSANEGVVAVFTFWKEYILKHGKPLAIYLDRFSTYKINHKSAVDNQELMTQFQRATKNLGIELITAYSPEAKGRVERLFGTLQDRLVKEMRLEGINTPEEGNKFLENVYISGFNSRFSVISAKEGNLHRELSNTDRKVLNRIFSIQSARRVNNDFTIQFKNKWYQLEEVQPTTIRPRETILVEEWLDQTVHFSLRGYYLIYVVLPKRPGKRKKQPAILTTHRLNWKPAANHPWKKGFKQRS
jgi:transposase